MGITGLIPFLEKASTVVNIKQLQGSSVAVDSYCWLHKGVFACSDKLIRGESTDVHIQYCLKYVDMLLRHKIRVIMVFDGRHLPAKAETERRRRAVRNESKKLAKECLRNNEIEKAKSYMRRAIDVTHEMALELIKVCRNKGVDCIVAPYEADAQMAWLSKQGLSEYVVTEDSDLTLFGAQKVLFKLDLTGQALLVENTKLYLAMGCKPEKYTFDKFRRMCILSGCDYLDSLQGIGLKKACKFILTTEEDDMSKALKKIPSYLKMKHLEVTDEYIESFLKAEATFKHMFIYNPLERKMQRLHELDEYQTDECLCSNAGSLLDNSEQAFQLALGNLNPFTLERLDNWHPVENLAQNKSKPNESIWHNSKDFRASKEPNDKRNFKTHSGITFHFKKIEFKNVTEMEIAEKLSEEQCKLEESEIFSMYKYASPKIERKRRRRQSSSTDSEDDLTEDKDNIFKKHTYNPFAKLNTSLENIQKSPVCTNSSLIKLLSPKKTQEENINQQSITSTKPIKSRFFAGNIKKVDKKPFAARDLTTEMFKIENKTNGYLEQQQDLYCHSLRSPEKINQEKKKDIFDERSTDNDNQIVNSTEEVILLSDVEDDRNYTNLLSVQNSTKTQKSKLNKPRNNLGAGEPKQSKLSMFGFQKRPSLKKL